MTQLSKHYTDIAKSMGFELEQMTSVGPLKFIRIQHVLSSNDITLEREAAEKMLDFLNICQLETINQLLAERVEKLENAVFRSGKQSSRNRQHDHRRGNQTCRAAGTRESNRDIDCSRRRYW